jgi:hypothetical protein
MGDVFSYCTSDCQHLTFRYKKSLVLIIPIVAEYKSIHKKSKASIEGNEKDIAQKIVRCTNFPIFFSSIIYTAACFHNHNNCIPTFNILSQTLSASNITINILSVRGRSVYEYSGYYTHRHELLEEKFTGIRYMDL